jgi:hypothetical protein
VAGGAKVTSFLVAAFAPLDITQRTAMEKCFYCQEETQWNVRGKPVCLKCFETGATRRKPRITDAERSRLPDKGYRFVQTLRKAACVVKSDMILGWHR